MQVGGKRLLLLVLFDYAKAEIRCIKDPVRGNLNMNM